MLFIFPGSCCIVIKEQLVGLWLGVKIFLTGVWHVFVSRLIQSFRLLRSLWQLGSSRCDDYIICTTN